MTDKMLEAFAGTRKAGAIASGALDEVTKIVKPGVTTEEIDKLCYEFINDHKAYSAPLFYRGYPKSCCTSTNHVVCHGIPKGKVLSEGDIVNVDVTALKDGWHGDTSRMYFIGDVSTKANQLVKTTYVEKKGFSVVRDFCGHGVGKKFHEHPNILHYGEEKTGDKLKTGMIFTIEPMINEGQYETKVLNDGWTAVTKDKKLSAQFEHTVGITDNGYEIFTTSNKGLDYPPYKI